MARERVVDVYLPVVPDGGGSGCGVVAAMALLFGAVIVAGVGVLIAVVVMFPSPDYSTPGSSSTRTPGPCAPFCPAAPTTAAGGELR